MARRQPKIILRNVDNQKHKLDEVLDADAIYAVFYQNKPINFRSSHSSSLNIVPPIYKRVSFSNVGSALNMARRLNKKFNTNEFTVVKLTAGETIEDK